MRKKQKDEQREVALKQAIESANEHRIPQTIWEVSDVDFAFVHGWTGWEPKATQYAKRIPVVTVLPQGYFA